jgi:hypothetical protein
MINRIVSRHQQIFIFLLVPYFLFDQQWLSHIRRKGSKDSFLVVLLLFQDLDDLFILLLCLIYDKLSNQVFFSILPN